MNRQREIGVDLVANQPYRKPISVDGQVNADRQRDSAQAIVYGGSSRGKQFSAKCMSDGSFHGEVVVPGELSVIAATPDGSLAGASHLNTSIKNVSIALKPTVKIRGVLLGGDAQTPLANIEVRCINSLYAMRSSTGQNGEFGFRGIIPGEKYGIYIAGSGLESDAWIVTLKEFVAEDQAMTDLGKVTVK